MSKYESGKIYKIVDVGYNKCYIGSTCEELSQRMARHRAIYKQYAKGKRASYVSSFDLFDEFGLDNCKIELLEAVAVNNREELRQQEGKHIQNNECINKQEEQTNNITRTTGKQSIRRTNATITKVKTQ